MKTLIPFTRALTLWIHHFLKALTPHIAFSGLGFNTGLWGSRIMQAHCLLHLTQEAVVANMGDSLPKDKFSIRKEPKS